MKNELISILMPAYKVVGLIEESLESVKKQTYSNWELIVVEDGTNDGTKEIIDNFKSSVTQNVVYFRNEVNKGLAGTRNVAASLAKGSWYALLDSDDIWHKDHLLYSMMAAEENPEDEFIYSTFIKFYDKVDEELLEVDLIEKLKDPPFLSKNLPTALFNGYMIQPSATIFSSKLFETVGGFDDSLRCVEDLNFYFRVLRKGYKFIYTRKSTSYYRQNPDGLSSKTIPMTVTAAKVREEILGWNLNEIDKETMINKTMEAWLSVARLSRGSDNKLAKYAAKKALMTKFNLKTLFFSILIHSKL